jgi:hypothetical protein
MNHDRDQGLTAPDRARLLRHLQELIAAIDRRVPHIERAGEIDIARDAATLREKALARIAELEPTALCDVAAPIRLGGLSYPREFITTHNVSRPR